jgi:hypothetical protein
MRLIMTGTIRSTVNAKTALMSQIHSKPDSKVAMHHPPYLAGMRGSDLEVRDAFSPIFERYGVQVVLAGHDHDYQRSTAILFPIRNM